MYNLLENIEAALGTNPNFTYTTARIRDVLAAAKATY
jgi:hypothetical protein